MIYIDDTMPQHRKALEAGGEAMWLWVCGLGYCHQQGSEGVIPKRVLRSFASVSQPKRSANRLVSVGLWEEKGDDYVVHDWYPFNRKADDRRAQARRAAQIRWGGTKDEKPRSEAKWGNADAYASADASEMPEHDADAMPEHMRGQSNSNASRADARAGHPQSQSHPQPQPIDIPVPTDVQQGAREPSGTPSRDFELSKKLGAACTGQNRGLVMAEAEAVTSWARRYVDDRLIDEAIGFCVQASDRPALPRAIAALIRRKATDHDIDMPEFSAFRRR